jgi:hypothetical protein
VVVEDPQHPGHRGRDRPPPVDLVKPHPDEEHDNLAIVRGGEAMTAEVNNTEEARASSTNPVEMRGID